MKQPKILIVEDERITAEHLQDVLIDLGYEVVAAVSNGEAAIRAAERAKPDLVLMDIHIEGDMDGVETARILRERFRIPAVYLTAHADQQTLQRAREAEPLGYLVKPFQENELQASIEMALYKAVADRQSQDREARMEATLQAVGEGVIAVDERGIVTLLNPAAESWTGWTQQQAVGQPAESVFSIARESAAGSAENPLPHAARHGVLIELPRDLLLVDRAGKRRKVGGAVVPIRDHNGQPKGAVVVFGSPREEPKAPPLAPARAEAAAGAPAQPFQVIFESPIMRQLMHFAERVAVSEASTILLQGESGTGKDVLAKYLHYNSRRADQPFIAINCAAIPETLLESELFGYEKGAFTDAKAQKKGTFEMANGGAIFLDEVGELPLVLQAKLLRVLEDQSFRRLGGTQDIQVDVRVIAATNRPLTDMVREGRFRMDLYYRLNVIQIEVPPLRERPEDILPLANYFVGVHNQRLRRQIQGISPQAERALTGREWPGNVRELRNCIERAMLLEETSWLQPDSLSIPERLAQGEMFEPDDLPGDDEPEMAAESGLALDNLSLEEAERRMLVRALERSGGNQSQAARLLKISRDALRYKMKKFNLAS